MIKRLLKKKGVQFVLILLVIISIFYIIFAWKKTVQDPTYGISFNTLYARELGLNWQEVYDAFIDDLDVKKIRLAAQWNMVEPENDKYNFRELDYQVKRAEEEGIDLIFAVGKRLPRWPECHTPSWAWGLNKDELEQEVLEYIEATIDRYKDSDAIKMWQVENEPYLHIFAKEHCHFFDAGFLDTEIDLVKKIDPTRKVMVTDSGELSTWREAYKHGDVFGTTLYVYAWNEFVGEFRNPFLPGFYSIRKNILNLIYGKREAMIAELALEPWLDKTIRDEKIEIQVHRMSPKKFDNVIEFAKKTGFETQYLWGGEWWYYMKLQDNPWYWNRGKEIFSK